MVCIIAIIKINHDIAMAYLAADGKTRALFGIIEWLNYGYRYYFILLSIGAIIFAIKGSMRKETKVLNRIAYALSVLSVILIFFRLWMIFA